MTVPALLTIIVTGLLAGAAPAAGSPIPHQVPATFAEHVARYTDLHQAVAHLVGLDASRFDHAALLKHEQTFAAALREAREFAKAGEIFTPEVAEFFRARLAAVVRATGYDTSAAVEEAAAAYGEEEGVEDSGAAVEVNSTFPPWVGRATPEWLLWQLPPLPMELEYRFFGTTLVLVDTRAGLVVDLLEAALPADAGSTPARRPRPCDVHPDLPACWT